MRILNHRVGRVQFNEAFQRGDSAGIIIALVERPGRHDLCAYGKIGIGVLAFNFLEFWRGLVRLA